MGNALNALRTVSAAAENIIYKFLMFQNRNENYKLFQRDDVDFSSS